MGIKRTITEYYEQLSAFSVFPSVFEGRGDGFIEINRQFKHQKQNTNCRKKWLPPGSRVWGAEDWNMGHSQLHALLMPN